MSTRLTTLLRTIGVALLATLMLATPAVADDDDDHHGTATATATSGSGQHDLGAFIRAGTCDAPGDVVEDIGDLDVDSDDDDTVWDRIGKGDPEPDVVYDEEEDIHQTVDELTGRDYVITIHARDDVKSDVIACGAIAGDVRSDGGLLIDLAEVDGSGWVGRAHFAPHHDDDDETEVTVGVWQGPSGTPEATPGGV
jgi:hypothetical protein